MRIAITQRVEQVPGYAERRDCLDQQWTSLLQALGFDLIPVPNGLQKPEAWLARQSVAGLLFSGGNDLADLPNAANVAPERDATERALLSWAQTQRLPVLGVCRGMQMLNDFLGGSLSPVKGHIACNHQVRSSGGASGLFAGYREVNSFHGWGISSAGLAATLQVGLRAEDGTIEAFAHANLPWIGIMWHPERPSPCLDQDLQLIRHLFSSKD